MWLLSPVCAGFRRNAKSLHTQENMEGSSGEKNVRALEEFNEKMTTAAVIAFSER